MEMTGIPPHTVLLNQVENLRSVIKDLRGQLNADFKETLSDELDAREVGGSGFAQSKENLSKLDELLERRGLKNDDYEFNTERDSSRNNVEDYHNNPIEEEGVVFVPYDDATTPQTRELISR